MSLQNIKNQKGFTIVELLIVIVVIGILAAIVIVAYNGVTNRANTASAQGNATAVKKVAEIYPSDPSTNNTNFPTLTQLTGYTSGVSRIPSGVTVQAAVPDASNGKTTVGYTRSNTGACVAYWDFTAGAVRYVGAGAATLNSTASTCTP